MGRAALAVVLTRLLAPLLRLATALAVLVLRLATLLSASLSVPVLLLAIPGLTTLLGLACPLGLRAILVLLVPLLGLRRGGLRCLVRLLLIGHESLLSVTTPHLSVAGLGELRSHRLVPVFFIEALGASRCIEFVKRSIFARVTHETHPVPPAQPLDEATRERLVYDVAFALFGNLLSSKRKGGGWTDDAMRRRLVAADIVKALEISGWLFGLKPPRPPRPPHSTTHGFKRDGKT